MGEELVDSLVEAARDQYRSCSVEADNLVEFIASLEATVANLRLIAVSAEKETNTILDELTRANELIDRLEREIGTE